MSKKNKWRRCGGLEFRRETQRYDDGTPTGGDVLWIRTPKGTHPSGVGRNVAFVTFRAWGGGARCGIRTGCLSQAQLPPRRGCVRQSRTARLP